MTTRRWIATGLLLGAVSLRCAAGDGYNDAVEAYKKDLKRDDPHLVNGGFIGNLATSQARRQWLHAQRGAEPDAPDADGRRNTPSSYNSNSPQIYGTVRGDVTIVTTRGGGRRGSLTSVKR